MEEKKNNYYYIKINNNDNNKESSDIDLEGIIIDITTNNTLKTHRYYVSFLDENQEKFSFYRIKSIKTFLALLEEEGFSYTIEPSYKDVLDYITKMSKEKHREKIINHFLNDNYNDERIQKIYNYLSSSEEKYTVAGNNINKVSDYFEGKKK